MSSNAHRFAPLARQFAAFFGVGLLAAIVHYAAFFRKHRKRLLVLLVAERFRADVQPAIVGLNALFRLSETVPTRWHGGR